MSVCMALTQAGLVYDGREVLHRIDLAICAGERLALIGANGAGKSSLLRLIHGLVGLSQGQRVAAAGLRQAMLFQRPHMLNTNTQRHVALGLWLAGRSWREAMDQALLALQRFGLAQLARQSARTLSGGQQQRVALARVWALRPDLLLLDEPTSSLDPRARQDVEHMLATWLEQAWPPTLVFASHNLGQVKRLATRVIYLEAGRVLTDLPVHDFFNGPLQDKHPQAHHFVRGQAT